VADYRSAWRFRTSFDNWKFRRRSNNIARRLGPILTSFPHFASVAWNKIVLKCRAVNVRASNLNGIMERRRKSRTIDRGSRAFRSYHDGICCYSRGSFVFVSGGNFVFFCSTSRLYVISRSRLFLKLELVIVVVVVGTRLRHLPDDVAIFSLR